MSSPGSQSNQHDAEDAELAPAGTPKRQQSSSNHSQVASSSNVQQRPANNVRPRQMQHVGSNASRAATSSTAPSTSNTHTSYASFPSQHSSQALITAASQPSAQSQMQPRSTLPPASIPPQGVRGYQNVTSVEPAPKRPLWSLGSTLPRVRRLPVKPTKTAYPTPGSRSNIVQQPPVMVPMQSSRIRQGNNTQAGSSTSDQAPSDSLGGPEELVRAHDYANTTGNENYTATGVAEEGRVSEELHASSEASDPTSATTGDLPPIVEGEPLPTSEPRHPAPEPSEPAARPRLDYSFSSPTVADTATIRAVGDDKLRLNRIAKQDLEIVGGSDAQNGLSKNLSSSLQSPFSSDPQQRLSAARKQLVQEAQHGDGLLATQGSAVDGNDEEDEEDEMAGQKSAPGLGGVQLHPEHKHIKTSSMPFLPSQGFDVLLAAPSHKGADQLHHESQDRKKARSDSQNRSALEQTRHPGLSGARPTPRGRAAGGPAAGVGIRKPSTQSNRRASNATNEDRSAAGYFDDDVPLHELTHLDRQGSGRHRRGSQQSHQAEGHHIEARSAHRRSNSHQSSNEHDTRSAWIGRSMPSHASRQKEGGQRNSREADQEKRSSLQQGRDDHDRKSLEASEAQERQSKETAYSSSTHHGEDTGQGFDLGEESGDQAEGWGTEQKEYVGDDDDMWLGGQGTYEDGSIAFPTIWSRWRYHSREFLAELLATMLLITVGTAVDCQVTLSQSTGQSAGSYPNQNWAWGIAVASTIYLSGGRSGAHCNPAITLALAVFRGFPWIQVPIYWSAQLLGSILGAAITYGIYLPAIDQYEGGSGIRTLTGDTGTGRLFVTVPQLVFTPGSGFGTEVVATSILMAMVLAVGDETNAPPSDGLSALVLGFVVVMIGMSFGWPTSYAISPSRDLGPRLFLYMVGYGKELWTHNSYWWIYGPQVGCFTGGLVGALLYDLAIFTGEESPINYTRQGWKQSTPARLGSRVLNSAERLEFWISPLRRGRRGQNAGEDDGKMTRDEAIARSRSENAVVGMNKGTEGGMPSIGSLEENALSRLSGSNEGQRRRQSHASQQLDAEEQGRSLSTSG